MQDKLVLSVGKEDALLKSSSSHNDFQQVASLPSTVEDLDCSASGMVSLPPSPHPSHFSNMLVKSCRIFAHDVYLPVSNSFD